MVQSHMSADEEEAEHDKGDLCMRIVCDMRCLVAITFIFLAIFISIIVVGVASQDLVRDVDPELSLVVVDTDMGVDDAYALAMLLEAENRYYDPLTGTGPKVIAITCVNGNTKVDNVVVNVLKILTMLGRLDGTIPVFRGASKPILKTKPGGDWYGLDGLGDVADTESPSLDNANTTHAAVALVELVNAHPGNITLLAIGPLTNIAMAIRLDEDFLKKLKHLFILGGATKGRGNKAPGAEFNFWMDPEANYVVLRDTEFYNDTTTLLAWDEVQQMEITRKWRDGVLGTISSPLMAFLNKAELAVPPDYLMWDYSDPVAAALLLRPQLAAHRESHAILPFTEGDARGIIAVDYLGSLTSASTVRLVGSVNVDSFKNMLLDYFSTIL